MLLNLHGIQIEFPYDAYECQVKFIEKVIEALRTSQSAALESPTGTGKTLCLLCGALAFVKDVKSKLKINVGDAVQGVSSGSLFPKILYASRTHSQLTQVVRELNKTLYKDTKTVTLASRDVLCINEKVNKEENTITKALMCRNLVKSRKCPFYNEFEKLDNTALDLIYSEDGLVPDIEDLITISKRHRICPFYRTRSAFDTAELVLLPYNYIVDPRLRHTYNVELKGNIIIFDEAHNLEAICEESVSVSLSSIEISGATRECKLVLESLINDEESIRSQKDACNLPFTEEDEAEKKVLVEKNDVAHLLSMLQTFETEVDDFTNNDNAGRNLHRSNGKVYPGQKIIELLEKAEIRFGIRDEISLLVDKIGQYLAQKAAEEQSLWAEKGVRLQKFSSFISTVYADDCSLGTTAVESITCETSQGKKTSNAENFQLFVTKEKESTTLNYWCFTPAVAMKALYMRGVRSVIVTSGTLSPLDSFINGLRVDIAIRLQNKHVASSDQILTACIRSDCNKNLLCGSYNNRNNDTYLFGVGDLVHKVCSLVPQGVLVFFASYMLMHTCIKKWKKEGGNGYSLWNEICRAKKPFVEPKAKQELKLVLIQFREAVREGNGGVLFGVCRAKISEGIDFADCDSRGVIIVGVPYAPTANPRVELKRQFLTNLTKTKDKNVMRKVLTADEWYQIDAVRAVNQAIGRVLRHKEDFGVVVLADSRFSMLDKKHFPLWLQSSVRYYDKINDFEQDGISFFKRHGLKVEQSKKMTSFNSTSDNILVKKRRLPIRANGLDVLDNSESFLKEVEDLYANEKMLSAKRGRNTLAESNSDKETEKALSALERIDQINAAGVFNELEKFKKRFSESLDCSEKTTDNVTVRRKIKLKPNSSVAESSGSKITSQLELRCKTPLEFTKMSNSSVAESSGSKITSQLELRCKTPLEFTKMLHHVAPTCRMQVKKALQCYAAEQSVDALIKSLTTITLPQNPEIFLG